MFHNRIFDLYNPSSAALSFGHDAYYDEAPREEGSSSCVSQTSPNSEEDVILASSCPKKRAGRKKFKETRHPVYRGVRQRNGNKWVCEVRTPNNKSRIWLGTYPTAEMAARAHDVAALALRGRIACLNFADSASILPLPASMSITDIQRKAAEIAEIFRPPSESCQESVVKVSHREVVTHPKEVLASEKNPEVEKFLPQCSSSYMDEEAALDMPMLLANMAEGLLLPPPCHLYQGFSSDELDSDGEVSLWSF
ncbi:basic helix-loop-helix protein [Dionaea muscipula]